MTSRHPVVHLVVPATIDDPTRPSGGNHYDRRIATALGAAGWQVREHRVAGRWPVPDVRDLERLARSVDVGPDDGVLLVDGLIASASAPVLLDGRRRAPLVVLVHMLFGEDPDGAGGRRAGAEGAVLRGAAAVVTTSGWTRQRVLARSGLPARRVHVVAPGVDPSPLTTPRPAGNRWLCVGAVTPAKGQDVLIDALARLRGGTWTCRCVGAVDQAPAFVDALRHRARRDGLGDRVAFTGALHRAAVAAHYEVADLLVLPSRTETYGMVVTEALARGVPVVASDVGGVAEAMGRTAAGRRPGVLVPPDDATALAGALHRWSTEPAHRDDLREAAGLRRAGVGTWDDAAAALGAVLSVVWRSHRCAAPAGPG